MSKTAVEWTNEGDKFDDDNKLDDAIRCFNEALALDPAYGRAYFLKAFVLEKQVINLDEPIALYRKAMANNYATDRCHENLGNDLMMQGKLEEAIPLLKKSYELSKDRTNAICYAGKLSECLGRKEDAMVCYDLCLKDHPAIFKPNYFKANLLCEAGKYEESLPYYVKGNNFSPISAGCGYRYAAALQALGRKDEATQWYTKASQTSAEASIDVCLRGQSLLVLGKKEEAMKDFKKAQEIINRERKEMLAPDFINFIKATLKSVFDAEAAFDEVQAAVNKLDSNNAIAKKFTMSIKKLQEQKNKAQEKALGNIDRAPVGDNKNAMSELELLKEEFQRQLAELQGEVKAVKSNVTGLQQRVTNIENGMEDMKEELKNKMDDFNKKLDAELKKQDITPDGQAKLKGYFKAFVETFSSIHVTSQVVDSGQVQIDSDSSTASVLSFIASFAPFVGSTLSQGIKSVGDFLKSKEMKSNARKIKRLAADATELSQLIGKVAFQVVTNKKKQAQILAFTNKESQEISRNVFQKLVKFCNDLEEKVDVYLYSDLYKTPSEKLGHSEANDLVEKWVDGTILPSDVAEQLIEMLLNPKTQGEAEPKNLPSSPPTTRACCNVF